MPVQQMITMVMTVLPSSPLTDTSPCGDRTPMARRREPNRRRTPITGRITGARTSPVRSERVGVGGVVLVEHLPAAAPLALGPRIRCHRRYPAARLWLPACERWTVHARRDAPFPSGGHPPEANGPAGSDGRAPAPQDDPHHTPRRIPERRPQLWPAVQGSSRFPRSLTGHLADWTPTRFPAFPTGTGCVCCAEHPLIWSMGSGCRRRAETDPATGVSPNAPLTADASATASHRHRYGTPTPAGGSSCAPRPPACSRSTSSTSTAR